MRGQPEHTCIRGNNIVQCRHLIPALKAWAARTYMYYTVKIISKRLPYFGATELHPIWVNVNPGICEPG